MEREYKNGVLRTFDFEIDKALNNLERGISLETFFKCEAEKFKYGAKGYFEMLEKEIEDYESRNWDYLIETNQLDSYDVSEIIEDVKEIKKVIIELQKLNPQPTTKQLKTNLTDTQRGKLFDLLVLHGFIPDKDKAGFIWAFGSVNDNYTSYSTEWQKQSNLAVYLIDNICIDNGKLWAIGSRIFGINNMAQIKQSYFSINRTGKPKGYELIDTIISEAQK
jgi:hypothetical protein